MARSGEWLTGHSNPKSSSSHPDFDRLQFGAFCSILRSFRSKTRHVFAGVNEFHGSGVAIPKTLLATFMRCASIASR
jgi:hypothetical protein